MSGPLSSLPLTIPGAALSDASLTDASLSQSNDLVPTTSVDYATTLGSKTAGRLLVYDQKLAATTANTAHLMNLYRDLLFPGATVVSFHGFAGLVSLLQEYATIDELMLHIHGSPGQFEVQDPDGVKRVEYMSAIAGMFNGVAPKVTTQVILESCVVAHNPHEMATLKGLFKAPMISGWTYFHVVQPLVMTVGGGDTVDTIGGRLTDFPDMYRVAGSPTAAEMVGKPGQYDLLYEWFRESYNATRPGPNPDSNRVFLARGSQREVKLTVAQTEKMTQLKDPADPYNPDGVVWEFSHVTITDA